MNSIIQRTYNVTVQQRPGSEFVQEELWTDNAGRVHRIGGPAKSFWDPTTEHLVRQEYWIKNSIARDRGPAVLTFDPDSGGCNYRAWMIGHDFFHRADDQPAIEHLDHVDGAVLRAEFFNHGVRHRKSGPAVIVYDPQSGQPVHTEWFHMGRQVDGNSQKPSPSP